MRSWGWREAGRKAESQACRLEGFRRPSCVWEVNGHSEQCDRKMLHTHKKWVGCWLWFRMGSWDGVCSGAR